MIDIRHYWIVHFRIFLSFKLIIDIIKLIIDID